MEKTQTGWADDSRFIDPGKLQEWIRHCKRFGRYRWYERDLHRKRPKRKKGRDLYHGILAYRMRVGQHDRKLCFRGVSGMYDKLRAMAFLRNPELAAKMPDLYMQFLWARFPRAGFEARALARPVPLYETVNRSVLTQFYHDLETMRITVPIEMAGELARTLDGKDAVLARTKEVDPEDKMALLAIAMSMKED